MLIHRDEMRNYPSLLNATKGLEAIYAYVEIARRNTEYKTRHHYTSNTRLISHRFLLAASLLSCSASAGRFQAALPQTQLNPLPTQELQQMSLRRIPVKSKEPIIASHSISKERESAPRNGDQVIPRVQSIVPPSR